MESVGRNTRRVQGMTQQQACLWYIWQFLRQNQLLLATPLLAKKTCWPNQEETAGKGVMQNVWAEQAIMSIDTSPVGHFQQTFLPLVARSSQSRGSVCSRQAQSLLIWVMIWYSWPRQGSSEQSLPRVWEAGSSLQQPLVKRDTLIVSPEPLAFLARNLWSKSPPPMRRNLNLVPWFSTFLPQLLTTDRQAPATQGFQEQRASGLGLFCVFTGSGKYHRRCF